MSPTIYRYKKYRFFFNSREETRKHIHVDTREGTAKFWLEPLIALSVHYHVSTKELREIEKIIEEKKDEFINAWNRHLK